MILFVGLLRQSCPWRPVTERIHALTSGRTLPIIQANGYYQYIQLSSKVVFMKRTATVAILAVAGLILTGCGGSSGPEKSPGSGSTATDANATVNYGVAGNPVNSLDPHKNTATYGSEWFGPAYETLLNIDSAGALSAGLATKWDFSADNLTLSLTVRDGVKFHDGTVFDAAAVKANIDRAKAEGVEIVKTNLSNVSSVTVASPTVAELHLKEPSAVLLQYLALQAGFIVSPAAFNAGTLDTKPDGTGPFILDSYVVGQKASYSRNPAYWGEPAGVAHFNVIEYADTAAGNNALVTGQLDIYEAPDAQAAATMKAAGAKLDSQPGFAFDWVELNWGGKFSDLRVRQALAYATDAEALVKFAGIGTVNNQWVTPESPYYDASIADLYSYDLDKAKALLAEAGFANGFSFTLWHTERTYTNQSGEILQAQWAKAGFDVKIRTTDGATILKTCFVDRTCDAISGIATLTPDFASYTQQLIPAGAPRNLSDVALPGFEKLLPEALLPSADRTEKVKALQVAFTKALPAIIFRAVSRTYGLSPKLESFILDANNVPVFAKIKMAS